MTRAAGSFREPAAVLKGAEVGYGETDELQELRAKVEELSAQVHLCPKCGVYCNQCQCWQDDMETAELLLAQWMGLANAKSLEGFAAFLKTADFLNRHKRSK